VPLLRQGQALSAQDVSTLQADRPRPFHLRVRQSAAHLTLYIVAAGSVKKKLAPSPTAAFSIAIRKRSSLETTPDTLSLVSSSLVQDPSNPDSLSRALHALAYG
jgi:hypothetical protein